MLIINPQESGVQSALLTRQIGAIYTQAGVDQMHCKELFKPVDISETTLLNITGTEKMPR